ncbi:hypothetical protein KIPB_009617 [Kipferlia bialata]|uniref:Reverse transcriptase domain-containing protein n=1 Tax=Kipferlia bialata TaxID=797122 RepID=A0A9K3D2M6_9EUKA|nr:hypothetical protein KIPB_009617 [Kipferlia bialata]|eukprot:g9617.t1
MSPVLTFCQASGASSPLLSAGHRLPEASPPSAPPPESVPPYQPWQHLAPSLPCMEPGATPQTAALEPLPLWEVPLPPPPEDYLHPLHLPPPALPPPSLRDAVGSMSAKADGWSRLGVSRQVARWLREGPPLYVPASTHNEMRVSTLSSEELVAQVNKYLEAGVYEYGPIQAGGPLFGVPRKEGDVRVVHDLTLVNVHSHPPRYRLWAHRRAALRLRKGMWLAKLDLKSGYSQILLRPEHRALCGATLPDGRTVRARALPFGACASPFVFQHVMASWARWLEAKTGVVVIVYIDDVLMACASRRRLLHTLHLVRWTSPLLGLVWGDKSEWTPTQRLEYLGLIVDTLKGTFAVPVDKARRLVSRIKRLISTARPKRRDIQSLCGSIMFLRPAFPQCLLRLRTLQSTSSQKGRAPLPQPALEALDWFLLHLQRPHLPSASFLPPSTSFWITTDATMHHWGAVLWFQGQRVDSAQGPLPPCPHIMVAEGMALKHALSRWETRLAGQTVVWLGDNMAALAVVERGSAKAPQALVDIGTWCADWQLRTACRLSGRYVSSVLNWDADALSRPVNPPPLPIPEWHRIVQRFGHPQVLWSAVEEVMLAQLQGAPRVRPWRDRRIIWWDNPQHIFSLLPVLDMWTYPSDSGRPSFALDTATMVVVLPHWPRAPWVVPLQRLARFAETVSVSETASLPFGLSKAFARQGRKPRLRLYAIRLRRHGSAVPGSALSCLTGDASPIRALATKGQHFHLREAFRLLISIPVAPSAPASEVLSAISQEWVGQYLSSRVSGGPSYAKALCTCVGLFLSALAPFDHWAAFCAIEGRRLSKRQSAVAPPPRRAPIVPPAALVSLYTASSARDKRAALIGLLAFIRMARLGEILALGINDVSINDDHILVITRGTKSTPELFAHKIPATDPSSAEDSGLCSLLRFWLQFRESCPSQGPSLFGRWPPDAAVPSFEEFPNKAWVLPPLRALLARRVTGHSFRRSAAVAACMSDMSQTQLMAWGTWASVKGMLPYISAAVREVGDPARLLEGLITPPSVPLGPLRHQNTTPPAPASRSDRSRGHHSE